MTPPPPAGSAAAVPPSGASLELRHGDARASVVEVGGGLRSYDVGGRAVLDGYPADVMASAGRGQVLVPWPNRLGGGRYTFAGRQLQLPLSEAAKGNAIHGLVRWSGWALNQPDEASVVATHVLHPQPGYPFRLACSLTYRLSDEGLRVDIEARNTGTSAAPFGVGMHPYVTAGTPVVDTARLTVPAATWLEVDDAGLPVATHPVEGSGYDFRAPREIGPGPVDVAFTDLVRDADGLVRVRLAGPEHEVTLWADAAFTHVQVFTGDTVPEPERRRQGLALEPMTCPPDAFRSGDGLRVLEPGEAFTGSWGITP